MYDKAENMNDSVLIPILSSIGAALLALFGLSSKKVDKSEFKDHCKSDREDKKDMYKTMNDMNIKVTEIHTIIKERLK
jgi:hypothetical protein